MLAPYSWHFCSWCYRGCAVAETVVTGKALPLGVSAQLCPFPFDLVKQEVDRYPNADICWVQEEHKNQGYWSFIQPRLQTVTEHQKPIQYIGRNVSPSTATGSKHVHKKEFEKLLNDSFSV